MVENVVASLLVFSNLVTCLRASLGTLGHLRFAQQTAVGRRYAESGAFVFEGIVWICGVGTPTAAVVAVAPCRGS